MVIICGTEYDISTTELNLSLKTINLNTILYYLWATINNIKS
jgi:hypothetical protein